MKILLLIICLTTLGLQTHGQEVPTSKIDKRDLKTIIKVLTSDSLEGRGTGTIGQRKAEKFISGKYQEIGLLTFDQNSYLEKFKLNQTYWGEVYMKTQNIRLENFDNIVFQGRYAQNAEGLISHDKIISAPISKVKIKCERVEREIETANVIGIIKGKTDKIIVISAHYDHLGKSGKEYFPGADDNASGTAALLEIAEEFSTSKDLEYNLMFIATSGEEAGLLGSFYHVNRPNFNPKNIICNLNLDMISRSDDKHDYQYLYCIGTDQSNEIDMLIKKVDASYDKCSFDYSLDNSKDTSGLYTRSDQYNFYKKGILAIQFFSGLHADYHKPTDTVDKIDFNNLEDRVRLISLVIKQLESEGFKN